MSVSTLQHNGVVKEYSNLDGFEVGRYGVNHRHVTVGRVPFAFLSAGATVYGSWLNDTGSDIIVDEVWVNVDQPSSAASTVDVGIGTSAGSIGTSVTTGVNVNTSALTVYPSGPWVVEENSYFNVHLASGSQSPALDGAVYFRYINK